MITIINDKREPMYFLRADNGSSHKTIRCFDVLEALQETIKLREQGYEVITHKNNFGNDTID